MRRIPTVGGLLIARRFPSTTAANKFFPSALGGCLGPASSSKAATHRSMPTISRRMYYGDDDRSWWKTQEKEKKVITAKPGSKAFVSNIEDSAVIDLFFKFATKMGVHGQPSLDLQGVHDLLKGIGERHDDKTVKYLFDEADVDSSGCVDLEEFLVAADKFLGSAPARIVLIVGGPGSGKGMLSERLAKEAGLVHLSSGNMLREEVERGTVLGKQVQEIMARGELVSSEIFFFQAGGRIRDHPGKRVLLDGFPR